MGLTPFVTFIGTDYLGIAFNGGGEALFRRDSLAKNAPTVLEPMEPARETPLWPASTFILKGKDARHFLGSHWDPFVENLKDLLGRLPEILPNALVQTGYGESRQPARSVPDD